MPDKAFSPLSECKLLLPLPASVSKEGSYGYVTMTSAPVDFGEPVESIGRIRILASLSMNAYSYSDSERIPRPLRFLGDVDAAHTRHVVFR